jgi:hypothetical protein
MSSSTAFVADGAQHAPGLRRRHAPPAPQVRAGGRGVGAEVAARDLAQRFVGIDLGYAAGQPALRRREADALAVARPEAEPPLERGRLEVGAPAALDPLGHGL